MWRFITMFTRAHRFSLSSARWIQTIPSYHTSIGSIIISSHLCLSRQSGPCPSGTHTKLIMHFCCFPCMSCTSHIPSPLSFWGEVQIMKPVKKEQMQGIWSFIPVFVFLFLIHILNSLSRVSFFLVSIEWNSLYVLKHPHPLYCLD